MSKILSLLIPMPAEFLGSRKMPLESGPLCLILSRFEIKVFSDKEKLFEPAKPAIPHTTN
jgi:hypothetical protein